MWDWTLRNGIGCFPWIGAGFGDLSPPLFGEVALHECILCKLGVFGAAAFAGLDDCFVFKCRFLFESNLLQTDLILSLLYYLSGMVFY